MKKILFPVVVLFALTLLTSGCGNFFTRVKGVFSSSKATDSQQAAKKPGNYLVAERDCNVRSEPNMDCKILAIAKKGERLEKIGESGSWLNIKLASGESGWVFKDLVKEVQKGK